MNIAEIEINKIKPYERNPKQHPRAQVEKIAKSIKSFGFNVPVLVDKDNNLIAGHGRVIAAEYLELKTVPAIRLEHLTPAQANAFRIADNKLAESDWLWDNLREEMNALQALQLDLSITGFTPEEIGAIQSTAHFEDLEDIDLRGNIIELNDCLIIRLKNTEHRDKIKNWFGIPPTKKSVKSEDVIDKFR